VTGSGFSPYVDCASGQAALHSGLVFISGAVVDPLQAPARVDAEPAPAKV
jgi:hypothetical protein